ncbi:hypothetical protein [Alienimonas chondri]|uniref:Secreted protein n=1 Tax=Alienimonas chondri TaxID=2681879 RepID=A0ABX1VDN9_9PLAN|nr:hypothetical protein [Alienimonas chondri]NNJ25923.1 hypothetical protein [Alienimonas chondri]
MHRGPSPIRRSVQAASVLALAAVASPAAVACPYCDSDVGQQVWAGIFNEDFWLNGLLTTLPIPVMALIVGVIHFGLPWQADRTSPRSKEGQAPKQVYPEPERVSPVPE